MNAGPVWNKNLCSLSMNCGSVHFSVNADVLFTDQKVEAGSRERGKTLTGAVQILTV